MPERPIGGITPVEPCRVDGSTLVGAYTFGSKLDNNSIRVVDEYSNSYNIKADVILEVLKHMSYTTRKARKYTYLEVEI